MGISLGTKVSFEEKKPKISDQLLKLTSRILYLGGRHVQVKNNGKVETISENERFSTIAKVAKVSLLVLASLFTVGVVCLNRHLARKYQRQDVSAPSSAPSSKREDSVRKDPEKDPAPVDFDGASSSFGPGVGYVVGPLAKGGAPGDLGSKILVPEEPSTRFKETIGQMTKAMEQRNAQLYEAARKFVVKQEEEYDRTLEALRKGALDELLISGFNGEFQRFKEQVEIGKKTCSDFPEELSEMDSEQRESLAIVFMPEIRFSLGEKLEEVFPRVKEFRQELETFMKSANEARLSYLSSSEEHREEKGQAFLKTLEALEGKIPAFEAFLQSLKIKKED